ncbi:MAG: hypothetical protein ACMG6E_00525 [Candidatus Roizmanbacteria bacterium]
MMNKTTMAHVAVETTALVAVVAYFVKQNNELREELAHLKKDLQVVAQQQSIYHGEHVKMVAFVDNEVKKVKIAAMQQPKPIIRQAPPPTQQHNTQHHVQQHPKVISKPKKDEMDEAYGSSEESEDEPPPPPRKSANKPKRVAFAGKSHRGEADDMEAIRAKAAAMEARAAQE